MVSFVGELLVTLNDFVSNLILEPCLSVAFTAECLSAVVKEAA